MFHRSSCLERIHLQEVDLVPLTVASAPRSLKEGSHTHGINSPNMEADGGRRMATGTNGSGNGPIKTVTEHNIDHLNTTQMTPHTTRSYLLAQQSNSLPSTPYIGGRDMNGQFRTPSPVNTIAQLSSPRTARSESDTTMRAPGKILLAGCKYETGIMHFKRRMPYSLGSDKLESSPTKVKKHLEPDEEKKLSGDMRELYDRLQPTEESQNKRARFVNKLETLLDNRWPGNEIKVHVFGSSGNMLFTNDSDGMRLLKSRNPKMHLLTKVFSSPVDICITTRLVTLQRTCLLAKALGECEFEFLSR